MSSSGGGGGTPRKFSEKIAIIERKQNEDVNQFEDIMREVRSITTTPAGDTGTGQAQGVPIQSPGGLHPGQWNQLGGSLPNVHQLPSYQQQQQQMMDPWPTPQWAPPPGVYPGLPHMMRGAAPQPPPMGPGSHRSRSPEQHASHYHPYSGRGQRSPDRVPPLHPYYPTNYPQAAPPPHGLLPPDHWTQINRARSDPAIHHGQVPYPMVHPPHCIPGPSNMQYPPLGPPQHLPNQQGISPQAQNINTSPLQSPMAHMSLQGYGYPNGGSPTMQSPMGSPLGSSLMLDERTTPMMELSPPGLHEPNTAGSLPNLQQVQSNNPPNYYHQTVGQRHSTGGACGPRLVPGPMLTPESQSAPTSPHNNLDPNQQPQWPATRTYSNSPESLDIPKVVLTNPEGALGQHLECFNDLHDLTLDANDMNMLCNGSSSTAVDPVHEPQLLN